MEMSDMINAKLKASLRVRLLVALAVFGAAIAKAESPNVLFLAIDDLNTWLLEDPSRYAGKVIAPNVRRLAESGVRFDRAYTASPACSPSRTALLSGVSPWKSGVYENGQVIEESVALKEAVSLPERFQRSGYYMASYGKIGHGWENRSVWNDRIPHKRDPVPPNAPLMPAGKGEQDWGPIHIPEEEMGDTKYADAAIAQLQKKHDQPFFIACGLFHPHMPWYVPQKYFDMYPLDEVVIPELKEGDLDDVPPLGRQITDGKSKFVESVMSHGEHRRGVQAYLATTTYADAQMGRVLDALEASPYRDNTIVMLMSDHGFHLAEKGHWQKMTLWEEATHCLLMFRVPGVTQAGGISNRFVSLQDIYPTLAELCAIETPNELDGRSLLPLLENPNAPWPSTAISAFSNRYVSIRNEGFRYIRYSADQEELYNSRTDPHEWTNQIDNPEYAAALNQLRSLVPSLEDMAIPVPSKKRR